MLRLFGEVLMGGVRLSHALAAALWVGGTLVYALVSPTTNGAAGPSPSALRVFREALRLGIGVFVISGVLLSVERLGSAPLPPAYFAILIVKIALGIWMFAIARQIGSTPTQSFAHRGMWVRPEYQVLTLGVVIYGLAIALRAIYESVIRA